MAIPISIAQHRLDFDGPDVGLGVKQRRRQIKNWSGYQTPAGVWAQTDQQIEQGLGTPPGWGGGAFEFQYQARNSACQVWVHENGAAPLYGIRRSENHAHWLNTQIVGGDSSNHTVYGPQKAIKYSAVFDGMDLWWQLRPDGVAQVLEVIDAGLAPSSWRQVYKMPAATQIVRVGDAFSLRDGQGVERLHIRAPIGWDEGSDGEGTREGPGPESIDIPIAVDVINTWTADGYRYAVVEFTPDAAARVLAVGNEFFDPTETVSSTVEYQDTYLRNKSGSYDTNYGGGTGITWGATSGESRRGVIRITSGSIPEGSYSAFRWFHYRRANANSTLNTQTLQCHEFTAADGDWTEGGCTWNNKLHPGTAWAGGVGAGSPGGGSVESSTLGTLGYDAYTSGPDALAQVDLDENVLSGWRTGQSDGFRVIEASEVAGSWYVSLSTENAGSNPYFEIDYSEGGGAVLVHYYRHMVGGQV
jgi:hypothetical protein